MSQADNTANPYLITTEPFYQSNSNEVALYEAAYQARLPVMLKGLAFIVVKIYCPEINEIKGGFYRPFPQGCQLRFGGFSKGRDEILKLDIDLSILTLQDLHF